MINVGDKENRTTECSIKCEKHANLKPVGGAEVLQRVNNKARRGQTNEEEATEKEQHNCSRKDDKCSGKGG